MYAKLFSRITDSSLMEEDIPVRYTFVLLLAVCDPHGYVIGTDIALSRKLNMPLREFQRCISVLTQPDEHSNSKEEDGRRVINSDSERGYKIVNYEYYRDLKTEAEKRDYMKRYMKDYRAGNRRRVKSRKEMLGLLGHAEADVDVKGDARGKPKRNGSRPRERTVERCAKCKAPLSQCPCPVYPEPSPFEPGI